MFEIFCFLVVFGEKAHMLDTWKVPLHGEIFQIIGSIFDEIYVCYMYHSFSYISHKKTTIHVW